MNQTVRVPLPPGVIEDALALHRRGQLQAAESAYQSVLAVQPRHPAALMGIGLIRLSAGNVAAALDHLECARRLAPRDPAVLNNLGLALEAAGRQDEATALWRRVLTIEPRFADAQVNLGNVEARAGRTENAVARFRAALSTDPRCASAAANLGGLLVGRRAYSEALHWLRRATTLDPGNADAWVNLGRAYSECGMGQEARGSFEAAVSARPGDPAASSSLLMSLHYCDDLSAEEVLERHRSWAMSIEPPEGRPRPPVKAGRPPRFRVGLLSGDFNDHAVMRFLTPVLERHDPTRDEIRCYYTGWREDACTELARMSADAFVPVAGLPDDQIAQRLREDDLDVLVDLSGHSAGGRPGVIALRPAPLQLSWLGYLGTTGLAACDFRLTDAAADPPGLTERLHSERLWRLQALWCYRPRPESPQPAAAPVLENGFITFGSTNNPAKLSESALMLWASVLDAVSGSRIVIHAHDDELCRQRIARILETQGVGSERLVFRARRDALDYLSAYGEIDVLLDTTPYSGGTTTCDALWMGVPVVTLAGTRPFSRTSASVLHAAGMPQWIATNPGDFVRIATTLATDVPALSAWRSAMRPRVAASRLCDEEAMVNEFSTCLRTLWREAGLPERAPE